MRCRFCPNDADYYLNGDPVCQSCDALIREEQETWAVIVETLLPMETVEKTVVLVEGGKHANLRSHNSSGV